MIPLSPRPSRGKIAAASGPLCMLSPTRPVSAAQRGKSVAAPSASHRPTAQGAARRTRCRGEQARWGFKRAARSMLLRSSNTRVPKNRRPL